MSNRRVGIFFFLLCLLLPLLVSGQQAAKDFTLRDINPASPTYNQQVTLSNYESEILVLFFFSTQSDQAQVKEILASLTNGMWASYRDECMRFFVIGGFARETEAQILGALPASPNANYPVLYDSNKAAWGANVGDLYRTLGGSNVPLAVVIDKDFNIYNQRSTITNHTTYNDTLVTWILEINPTDSAAPTFTNFNPPNNSTNISRCTPVEFDIFDDCSVNISTFSAGSAQFEHDYERISGGYHVVVYTATGCWPTGNVSLSLSCSDKSGTVGSATYQMTVAANDTTPPILSNQYPTDGQTGVDKDTPIYFDIYDDESCVDRYATRIYLQQQSDTSEQDVSNGATFESLDDHDGYRVTYDRAASYNMDEWVNVRITSEQDCGTLTFEEEFRFTIGEGGPSFTNKSPADGATNVPSGAQTVSVDVTDALYGVDMNSIQLSLNGESQQVSKTAIENGYHASFTSGLADSQSYTVRAAARNLSGMTSNDRWTFTTVDNTAPVLTSRNPANNAYNVSIDTSIYFVIYDSGVGVNQGSITLTVNGQNVSAQLSKVQADSGSDTAINCTYQPTSSFTEGETVTLVAGASDKNGNAMAPVQWSFTCSSVPAIVLGGWGSTGIYTSAIGEFEAWVLLEYGSGMGVIRNVQMYTEHPVTEIHYPIGIFL
ncbi:MAG: Ig-like domain-containing protein, partial [Candidatus Coatesbacteria bacterium]|nr:Ig-like domain-containing protein [Candidatus Coatesbacteria bacterium]